MEHLPYPRSPHTAPQRVPYVCTEQYDGGDWLTYPARVGWARVLPSQVYPTFMEQELISPSNDRELENLFQAWIFFGLLYKVLSPHNLYSIKDYVLRDAHGEYISTMTLLGRLDAWRTAVGPLPDADKANSYEQLNECLSLAATSMECLY